MILDILAKPCLWSFNPIHQLREGGYMVHQKSLPVAAAFIATGLVLASLIHVVGNRYSIKTGEQGITYRVNKLTGQMVLCAPRLPEGCRSVEVTD